MNKPIAPNQNMRCINRYDYLRFTLTILVVLGHAMGNRIGTNLGGVLFVEKIDSLFCNDIEECVCYNWFEICNRVIYAFHMPAFIALSGALFHIQLKRKRWSIIELCREKAVRLLIPWMGVYLLWDVPIKFLLGYYSPININTIRSIVLQQLCPQFHYLWFLPTLFIDFILMYYIKQKISCIPMHGIVVCAIFVMSIFVSKFSMLYILERAFQELVWFWLGGVLVEINLDFSAFRLFVLLMVFTLMYLYMGQRWIVYHGFLPLFGIIIIWEVCIWLENKNWLNSNNLILKNSYGIYLFSNSLNLPIAYVMVCFWGTSVISSNIIVVLEFIVRVTLTLAVSMIVSSKIKKHRHLKILC